MGILSSFNVGITGVNSISSGMAVVGDNIANAGTIGFKSSRPEFQDILSSSLKGIDGGDQIGSGVKLAHVRPLFQQGSIERTEQITDLAIKGDGFFTIEAPYGKGYTRDGSFHFDKEGHLITADGYKVLGFAVDEKNKVTNQVAPIKLGGFNIPATSTKDVRVQMNIDSRGEIKQFNVQKPDETSSFNSGIVVYDNVGTARLVNIYFNKKAENQWEYHALVNGEDAVGGEKGKMVEMANGTLVFNGQGFLQEEQVGLNSFNFNKGATQNQQIKLDFGVSIAEKGTGQDATTQFGSPSSVARHTQNGSSAASLSSLSFDDNGVLSAVYNNGEARDLAQMAIAKFENNEGLFKMGKNLYKETRNSGQAAMGKPVEGGRGEVLSKSIEQSNVDIAHEFVNMMTMQRNFSANTKTITTADQMLQEILNIKR